MPDSLLIVQRLGESWHHIATRHEHGPFAVSPAALCDAYAATGWAHDTPLTLAGLKMLRDMDALCEECDAAYGRRLNAEMTTSEGTIKPRKVRMP